MSPQSPTLEKTGLILFKKSILIALLFIAYAQVSYSTKVDSLLLHADDSTDTLVADEIYSLAKKYYTKDIDSSLMLAIYSAEMSERLGYINGRVNAYRGISAIAPRAGDNETALLYIDKGIQLIEQENLPLEQKLNFIINRGACYLHQSMIGEAIEANTEAYELALELGLKEKAGLLLNNMGILYRKTSDYDNAIRSYNESIAIRKQLNDSLGMANSLFNLGATYAKVDSTRLAFDVLQQAKTIFVKLNMKQSALECDVSLGTAAYDLGDYDQVKHLLQKLERDKSVKFDPTSNLSLQLYVAKLAVREGRPHEAKRLLGKIQELENLDFNEQKYEYFLLHSQSSEMLNKQSEALAYYKKYMNVGSQISNKEKLKFREEMNAKFQSVQKDFEIEQLEMQENLMAKKLKISRQRTIGLGIGVVLLGSFLWSLFYFYKKIKKKNVQISRANDANKILVKEIHHRVKNNLQVVSSLLNMQARKTKDVNTKDALKSSKSRVQSMSILHQYLYQKKSPTQVNVKSYFADIIDNVEETYRVDIPVSITSDVDSVMLDVDTLVPMGLILNELVSNAFKHAFKGKEKGKIQVWFKANEGTTAYTLSVIDDGAGLGGESLTSRDGSLGSKIVKEFANSLGGKLKVDSSDSGTGIHITFDRDDLLSRV